MYEYEYELEIQVKEVRRTALSVSSTYPRALVVEYFLAFLCLPLFILCTGAKPSFICCLSLLPLTLIVTLAASWKSYETIFDLSTMEIRSSGGRFGARIWDTQPLTPSLLIIIMPEEESVIIQLPNLCSWTLLKWYKKTKRPLLLSYQTPSTMPYQASQAAEQIVDWLNRHDLHTRLEVSSRRPVDEV